MSSLLSSHLEQMSLCATSIAELSFAGPRMFTNALLGQHDITSLIRDTEAHERALFHLAAPPIPGKTSGIEYASSGLTGTGTSMPTAARRATVYGTRQPKSKAVAAVLGGELYQQTRRDVPTGAKQKRDVDVELLLLGAERLCAVYPMPGARDKIMQLRQRHQQLMSNIAHYEARVEFQAKELERMNHSVDFEVDDVFDDGETGKQPMSTALPNPADLEREEAEVRELERKKKTLEDRVTDMERDLGGLMR